MSKVKESEAVVARCSSKKALSKISQIAEEKHPCWCLPSTKPQALRVAALLKRDRNTGIPLRHPQNLQEHPSLQNTSNDGSLWRKVKYDLV